MPGQPFDQSDYQVRLEWGVDGLARLAPSDVVVVVDILRFSSTVIQAVERGETVALDASARAVARNGATVAEAAARTGALVLIGGLRNASAVARAILGEQRRRAARTSVAIVAAGELDSRAPGAPLRFAVEDQLGAGAIVDALGRLGIDHTSPDAAVAGESFRGLRGAARHLLTASGSGRELEALGRRDEVLAAATVDAAEPTRPEAPDDTSAAPGGSVAAVVPVLRDGVFAAL